MLQPNERTIDTLLGKNNILVIIPQAHREQLKEDVSPMATLGRSLAAQLQCYMVINAKSLQFTVAAEVLAPIKSPADRDILYLEVIKPLAPSRPQLLRITKLLAALHPQPARAIAKPSVKRALEKACQAKQKAGTFIRLLQGQGGDKGQAGKKAFNRQIDKVRRDIFGNKANSRDFNILPVGKTGKAGVTLSVRLREQDIEQTIENLKSLLNNREQLDELFKLLK